MRPYIFSSSLAQGWELWVIKWCGFIVTGSCIAARLLMEVLMRSGSPYDEALGASFLLVLALLFSVMRRFSYAVLPALSVAFGTALIFGGLYEPNSTLGQRTLVGMLGAWALVRGYSAGPKSKKV